MTDLDDNFEYEVNPSAEPIKKGSIKVRIRNIKEAVPLEKEGE